MKKPARIASCCCWWPIASILKVMKAYSNGWPHCISNPNRLRGDHVLSRADMKWFWNHYLASDTDRENPYACPAYAKSLRGMPPAMVITAEYDPLRDEGETDAVRLREEDVPTVLKRHQGVTHGFFGMPDFLDTGKAAIADAGSALRAAIG
ncbi:MAG: alpha/beta hydrolase fold domain-containing protein [Candidatus Binataceae bacterium]